jgi:hypothetical protein
MTRPPANLDGAKVLFYAIIDEGHRPTGNTLHRIGGELMPPASGLAVCRYEKDAGFYLFYCDGGWRVLTDTWHESAEDARRQAEFEYEGVDNAWKAVAPEGAV